MTYEHELGDELPARRRLQPARLQQRKRHLLNELQQEERTLGLNRIKWALAAGVGALAIGGGVATSGLLGGDSVREFAGIDCFAEASLAQETGVLVNGDVDPVRACAEAWSQGEVVEGVSSAPELTACVLELGNVGVFPAGPETCEELGLSPLPGDYREQFASWEDASAAALTRIGQADCVGAEEARAIVEAEFAARGIDDWTIRIDESAPPVPAPAPHGCVGVSFDGVEKIVILIPDAGG